MKDKITVTQEDFKKTCSQVIDDLQESFRKNNQNAALELVAGLYLSVFAAKLTCELFREDEKLEYDNES